MTHLFVIIKESNYFDRSQFNRQFDEDFQKQKFVLVRLFTHQPNTFFLIFPLQLQLSDSTQTLTSFIIRVDSVLIQGLFRNIQRYSVLLCLFLFFKVIFRNSKESDRRNHLKRDTLLNFVIVVVESTGIYNSILFKLLFKFFITFFRYISENITYTIIKRDNNCYLSNFICLFLFIRG